MDINLIKRLAKDSVAVFEEVVAVAESKLQGSSVIHLDSFATHNPVIESRALNTLSNAQSETRIGYERLRNEPAIARVLVENEKGQQRTLFISRSTSVPLKSGYEHASYRSPMGRLAELDVGDEEFVVIKGTEQCFYVLEKTAFQTCRTDKGWDSQPSHYRQEGTDSYTIDSLRAFLTDGELSLAPKLDADELDVVADIPLEPSDNQEPVETVTEDLDVILRQEELQRHLTKGLKHQVLTAMGLRDQAILDKVQGEIFRMPIDSQLIILGPPGTGKTTTLIKRLGQKLDWNFLTIKEQQLIEKSGKAMEHSKNWIMFTPSELLKLYLKEAFSRESVPAPDTNIRTWDSHVKDIARNSLGILRTSNGGRFSIKADAQSLQASVVAEPGKLFAEFKTLHQQRLKKQVSEAIAEIDKAMTSKSQVEVFYKDKNFAYKIDDRLQATKQLVSAETVNMLAVYARIESLSLHLSLTVAQNIEKKVSDGLLNGQRNLVFNKHGRDFFSELGARTIELQVDHETDVDEEYEEDEIVENKETTAASLLTAGVNAYMAAIRALARARYQKKQPPQKGRNAAALEYLADNTPSEDILFAIGRSIVMQNALRRLLNAHKNYVNQLMTSYTAFRRTIENRQDFYTDQELSNDQLASEELDFIVLVILRFARELMAQSYIERDLENSKYNYLSDISALFFNQVMVDEATDFSPIQLACMESLTSLYTCSFFACGDINQRITSSGIIDRSQLEWVSSALEVKKIQTVYRQSRRLNEFSAALLRLQNGDLTTMGQVSKESAHEGCQPVLYEYANDVESIAWVAARIKEVERSVSKLPTIAVLVNSEQEVRPVSRLLAEQLADINVGVVACDEGRSLGEEIAVRVVDIQHIKGLEFEAVFFIGIDKLVLEQPGLFDRYLYVGATRAATYLGLVCSEKLPDKLEPIRKEFADNFGV